MFVFENVLGIKTAKKVNRSETYRDWSMTSDIKWNRLNKLHLSMVSYKKDIGLSLLVGK